MKKLYITIRYVYCEKPLLEIFVYDHILMNNKTRQGYVLRNTLKLAGYFFQG
jgi:hypothetical protein